MLSFNETALIQRLSNLSKEKQVIFALSCAVRLNILYENFERKILKQDSNKLLTVINTIWDLLNQPTDDLTFKLKKNLNYVMEMSPQEDNSWTPLHAFAEDAITATAYCIRSFLSGDPRESAWAARHAYEAADLAAQNNIDFIPGDKDSEISLLSHPLIQNELKKQIEDLNYIENINLSVNSIRPYIFHKENTVKNYH